MRIAPLCLCLLLGLPVPGHARMTAPPLQTRLVFSNPRPYVGEEMILTLELRYRGRPGGRIEVRWPKLDGFLADDLPPLLPRREEGPDGLVTVEGARKLLRPLAPGRCQLAGAGAVQNGRFLEAPAAALRVRPLPAGGRPEEFAGAVGEATMDLVAEGTGTRPVRLLLSGNAPLEAFPEPLADLGRGERLVPLGDALTGPPGGRRQRTLRYLYLPGQGRRGALAFRLAVFGPRDGEYRMLRASLNGSGALPPQILTIAAFPALALLAWLGLRRRRRRSLEALLEHLLDRPRAGLCRDEILNGLAAAGAAPDVLADLERLWRLEDRARFAPGPAPPPQELDWQRRTAAAGLRKTIDKRRRIP